MRMRNATRRDETRRDETRGRQARSKVIHRRRWEKKVTFIPSLIYREEIAVNVISVDDSPMYTEEPLCYVPAAPPGEKEDREKLLALSPETPEINELNGIIYNLHREMCRSIVAVHLPSVPSAVPPSG